jgi:hypothetical protein
MLDSSDRDLKQCFTGDKQHKILNTGITNPLLEMHRIASIGDKALAKAVLALCDEVHNSSHRGLCQQCLLIQMDNPIVITQNVHVIL